MALALVPSPIWEDHMTQQRRGCAWREGAKRKPVGGFRFITVTQLIMAWWAYREGLIGLQDLRAWFACHEALSRRCTLERGRKPNFTFAEIRAITGGGGGEAQTRACIRRLAAAGLLSWSPSKIDLATSPEQLRVEELEGFWRLLEAVPNNRRKVPVPRTALQLLAGGARRGVIATVLGHLLRGVFYRSGLCCPNGAVKASWIAETFGVGEATVKHARAHLVALELLQPQETPQWVMNRNGRWFRWNLDWERPAALRIVDNSDAVPLESTPPHPDSDPIPTPPESDWELSTRAKNQKPGCARPSGVSNSKGEEIGNPSLHHVVREDLDDTGRLLKLFDQATRSQFVDGGHRDQLRFVGAAEHARTIGSVNPPGLFAWLIRNRRWEFITDGDEDAANRRIKQHLYGGSQERRSEKPVPRRNPQEELSEDARFVRAARQLFRQRGIRQDPLLVVRRERPDWTRERWDAACRELDEARLLQAKVNAMGEMGTIGELIPTLALA